MTLFRFLLCLFIFIGALAAAVALVLSILLMLRFPPLMIAVVLACLILNRLLKLLHTLRSNSTTSSSASQ